MKTTATGGDRLSKGDHNKGIMAGKDPMSFLPFQLGADASSQGRVGKWVRSWLRTSNLIPGSCSGQDWGGVGATRGDQSR